MNYWSLKGVQSGTTNAAIKDCGFEPVVWSQQRDGGWDAIVRETRYANAKMLAETLGCSARPSRRLALLGVDHSVKNIDVMKCNVVITDVHTCGTHYEHSKDITVDILPYTCDENLRQLVKCAQRWTSCRVVSSKMHHVLQGDRRDKPQKCPLMLQVSMRGDVKLAKADKNKILEQFLVRAKWLKTPEKCYGDSRAGAKAKGYATYTFYIQCKLSLALQYTNFTDPLLDAVPFETEKGDVVYLNTLQVSSKPETYPNGCHFDVSLPEVRLPPRLKDVPVRLPKSLPNKLDKSLVPRLPDPSPNPPQGDDSDSSSQGSSRVSSICDSGLTTSQMSSSSQTSGQPWSHNPYTQGS